MRTFISIAATLLAAELVSSTPLVSIYIESQEPLVSELGSKVICDCSGTRNGAEKAYVCGDSRLGPVKLPNKFPLVGVVADYDRLGGLSPAAFLAKWTNEDGGYVYPPHDGYLLDDDGEPLLANVTLQEGTRLDRFGGIYGRYLAAYDAPFEQRALPPSSLNEDPAHPEWPFGYHVYRVTKPLTVVAGVIAPWFGQPGLGAQFWTGSRNVRELILNGYIEEVDKDELRQPGGDNKKCPWQTR